MGIDARLLLRVRGDKPTDLQVAKWADALCRSIGAQHFFISDGLPTAEYQAASNEWHKAFESHPLNEQWKESYRSHDWAGRQEIHKQIKADIGEPPKQLRRAIELTNTSYPLTDDDDVPDDYREPGRCYTQDGPTVYAKPGEWLLEVSLNTRHYGIDYERGDLITICAVAEWCEQNIPNCEVWYGGDSSGVCVTPFTESVRFDLRAHLYSPRGRDYYSYGERKGSFPTPKPCGLCLPLGSGNFDRYGWGQGYVAVNCGGCGKSFQSHDNGFTWEVGKGI